MEKFLVNKDDFEKQFKNKMCDTSFDMNNDWKRKDENGNPIIDMDGVIFPVLSENEQKDPKNTLYLWIDRYNGNWNIKFGATNKTIWDRYNDAGTIHLQQIHCWESELWDKDFEKLLHEKFNWCGKKDKNVLYSEEAYKVENANGVNEFIKCITHHVATHGKYLKQEYEEEYKKNRFKNVFKCRKEQERFVEKFIAYFNSNNRAERRFLLYAVCRYGKTATTLYTMIEKLHLKRILILSCKCDTKGSWFEDYEEWSFCKDYSFFDKEQIQQDSSLLNEKNIIAWCSFQSAAKPEQFDYNGEEIETDYEEEPWQKQVANAEWDIVVTDECHYGVDTKRSSKLINKIRENKDTFLLEISATPFKKIKRYNNQNIYSYTLIDEWNEHHNDKDYVPVHLYCLNILTELEKFKALFVKKPLSYNKVQTKIDNCLDEGKFSWRAYFSQFNTVEIGVEFDFLYENYFSKTGPHCLIYVNRVSDGDKLAKSLDKDKYEVINVCGDNKIKKEDIDKLLETPNKRVIIISCGRFMTGVTLKKLTNVIFMGKVNSAEMYIQYGLRGKNQYVGRTYPCAIYDLNTEVYVYSDPFKVMVSTEAKSKNKPLIDIVKNYEEALAIFEVSNNIFTQYNNFAKKFTETFSHIDGDDEIPFCSFEMNEDVLVKIKDFLTNKIEKNKKPVLQITEQQIETANELDDGSNDTTKKKGRKKLSNEEKIKLRKIYELRDKFREQVKYIPTFMKFNNIENVEDIFTEENTNLLKIWHNVNVELFKTLKEILFDTDWIEMCENIKSIKNKLPNDDMIWKYRGELPAWF